jgi:hypothetical protein
MAPAALAMRAAATVAGSGSSSWSSTTSAVAMVSLALSTSSTPSEWLARGTITIEFSPVGSISGSPTPVPAALSMPTASRSIPSASRAARNRLPNSSAPTRPTMAVAAPARAAATAWLKPLPPRNVSNPVPTSVSPGVGRRGA